MRDSEAAIYTEKKFRKFGVVGKYLERISVTNNAHERKMR